MRLSRPCACVFCYNLVQFLLQPCAFFATTREAPSWTRSCFCYNRFVVCCNQCQFLLPPTSLIFLEPALDFLFLLPLAFRFAGTSFNFCYHQVFGLLERRRFFPILLPTFYWFLLEPSRIFATTGGIFCCDRQIKDEEQHELYDGCCGRRRAALRAWGVGGACRRCAAGALLGCAVLRATGDLAGDAPGGPEEEEAGAIFIFLAPDPTAVRLASNG